jgi:hypothetical protein
MFRFTRFRMLSTMIAAAAFAGACSDDPAEPIPGAGDPENVSRVTVTLTPAGGGAAQTSSRLDPDGSQLPLPVGAASATLVLSKGVTYNGIVELLNDLDPQDVIDITDEVNEESEFHRFFYTFTCAGVTAPVAAQNSDTQSPPQPLGSTYQVVVDAAAPTNASCTMNVQLRHFETNKGDGAGTNFETDLDIDFPVSIQP